MCENDFSKYIKDLTRIFLETYEEAYKIKNAVLGVSKLKQTLFVNVNTQKQENNKENKERDSSDSSEKIDNKKYLFREKHLINLFENLLNDPDEYKITDSFFGNPLNLFYNSSETNRMVYALSLLYEKIINISDENACKWTNIEERISTYFFKSSQKYSLDELENKGISYECISSYYTTLICYYLLLHIAYTGLRSDTTIRSKNIIKFPIKNFEEVLSSNKRIAFVGDFACGKTTALKLFARSKRDNIFYFDAKYNEIGKREIFYALRPDIDFWNNNTEFNEIKKKYPQFVFPNFPVSNFKKESFYSEYLSGVHENNVLIIDHISKEYIDIIRELESLPCKVIFVLNTNDDISKYKIKVYKYDNRELLKEKIRKAYSNNENIDEKFFRKIYNSFGQDIFLYDLVVAAHKKYSQKRNESGKQKIDFR